MSGRPVVCLILEGSYPYVVGGVSAWVQELIGALPEIDFSLWSLSPKSDQKSRYAFPPNVVAHEDVVIGEHRRAGASVKKPGRLMEEISAFHASFASGSVPALAGMLDLMPEGYYLYADAVSREAAWRRIVTANQRHNPVYPFSDYFWSWKSAHDLLFTVLGFPPPAADLYHAASTGYAGLAGIVSRERTAKPFLLTEHGLYHKEREMEIKRAGYLRGYQRDLWIRMYNGLSRMCYRSADLVISLFEYNRRRQLEMGSDPERTIVIPNGIDISRFSSVVREKRRGFHVGFVGRIVPIKDVKTFILMAKIVSESIPDARFYCIGPADEDPAYYEDCRLLAESLRLTDRLSFTGRQDVVSYYGFLDVLVLSSIREAQPLVVLEAFMSGIPVVSTTVGNVPELLEYDERFLAHPKDSAKLAHSVEYVHEHEDEMGPVVQGHREKVEKFYDKRAVYKRYRDIYLSLTGRPL